MTGYSGKSVRPRQTTLRRAKALARARTAMLGLFGLCAFMVAFTIWQWEALGAFELKLRIGGVSLFGARILFILVALYLAYGCLRALLLYIGARRQ